MGHSQTDKADTHRKIVSAAAKRLREAGLFGVGVADLMKDAGLTVGGFYKHFASREELVAEALDSIDSPWAAQIERGRAAGVRDEQIAGELIDTYLSARHRDAPASGCMFAAVSGDLAKSAAPARKVATAKLVRAFDTLTGLFGHKRKREARALAIVTFSALLGALTFARMVDDEALSREILTTVAKFLRRNAAA